MASVVVLGSANLDIVATAARHPAPGETVLGSSYAEFPGGKGLNQAVAAVRSGAEVAFVTAVGDDDAGRTLIEVARSDGIDTSWVEVVRDPTGRALIVVSETGENSIVVVPGANSFVRADATPEAPVVLAQLEIPVDVVRRVFDRSRRAGTINVLNPAPSAALDSQLLRACDVVVPNEHELADLGGVDRLLASGVGAVVVTRGADGATISRRGERSISVPTIDVRVVDTTGAGDAFCGSLAARLASGDALEDAVRYAVAAGALATTRRGAVPSLPSADAVERAMTGTIGRSVGQPDGDPAVDLDRRDRPK